MKENWFQKNISKDILAASFIIFMVSTFVLTNFIFGFSSILFALVVLAIFLTAIVFPFSGLLSIIFLTVVFERFFTLSSFWLDKMEYKIYPLDFVIMGIIIGLILKLIQKKKKVIKLQKEDWLLIAFIILNIFHFTASIFHPWNDKNLAFSILKNYSFYPIIYFLTFALVNTQKKLEQVIKFFLSACLLLMGFIIIGIFLGEGLWTKFTPLSTPGIRILAFTHSFYLSIGLLGLIIYTTFFKLKNDFTWFLISLIWILGIIGGLMRHLWLGIAVSLLLTFIIFSWSQKATFLRIISKGSLMILIGLFSLVYFSFLFPRNDFSKSMHKSFEVVEMRSVSIGKAVQDESFSWRNLVWKKGFQEYQKNPFLGLGTGKKIYVEKENYRDYIEIRNVHNSYLSILFQLGFLGLGTFFWFLFELAKKIFTKIKKEKNYTYYIWGTLFIFFLFILNFQPYLETNLLAIPFWITLGLIRTKFHENTRN